MIEERPDKDRLKCPLCGGFIAEVKPRLDAGQTITTTCPRCHKEVTITK